MCTSGDEATVFIILNGYQTHIWAYTMKGVRGLKMSTVCSAL